MSSWPAVGSSSRRAVVVAVAQVTQRIEVGLGERGPGPAGSVGPWVGRWSVFIWRNICGAGSRLGAVGSSSGVIVGGLSGLRGSSGSSSCLPSWRWPLRAVLPGRLVASPLYRPLVHLGDRPGVMSGGSLLHVAQRVPPECRPAALSMPTCGGITNCASPCASSGRRLRPFPLVRSTLPVRAPPRPGVRPTCAYTHHCGAPR